AKLLNDLMLEAGLLPATYGKVSRQQKESLAEFLDRYEARQDVLRRANVTSTMGVDEFIQAATLTEGTIVALLNSPRDSVADVIKFLRDQAIVKALQGQAVTSAAAATPLKTQLGLDRKRGACFQCHRKGHLSARCPERRKVTS